MIVSEFVPKPYKFILDSGSVAYSSPSNIALVKYWGKKEAQIPNNLISVAKKTPGMTAGIVCADHESSMESAKKVIELDLIKPTFIVRNCITKTSLTHEQFNFTKV